MSLIKQLTGAMRLTVFLVTGLLILPGSSFARMLDYRDRLNGEQKAVVRSRDVFVDWEW